VCPSLSGRASLPDPILSANKSVSTGTNIIAKISAPASANPYVMDIGANILPGTPSIVNRGMKATRMISVENSTGRAESRKPRTMAVRAMEPDSRRDKWRKMFSSTTIDASTRIPKSIAPIEIRLAE